MIVFEILIQSFNNIQTLKPNPENLKSKKSYRLGVCFRACSVPIDINKSFEFFLADHVPYTSTKTSMNFQKNTCKDLLEIVFSNFTKNPDDRLTLGFASWWGLLFKS